MYTRLAQVATCCGLIQNVRTVSYPTSQNWTTNIFLGLVGHAMGKEKFLDGTETIFQVLQYPRLNKQVRFFYYKILFWE